MIDIKLITKNPELVKRKLSERGFQNLQIVDEILELDEKRREKTVKMNELQHLRNTLSKEVGIKKQKGEDVSELMEKLKKIKEETELLEKEVDYLTKQITEKLLYLPNIHFEEVPVGIDDSFNVEVRRWGEPRKFDFEPKPHWEIGEKLGIMDFDSSATVAGKGFVTMVGLGALLERAIINFFLTENTKRGYIEILPPYLVNSASLYCTGQLPKFEKDLYKLEEEDLYLNPTAEVPLINLYRDCIIPEELLPIKLTAYAPSFRREAGSYGIETRGLMRRHQFNKVELIKFTRPEDSKEEHEKMVEDAEHLLQLLGLPYRVVLLSSGDMSFSSAKTYDLEVWIPSQNTYKEISSVSNCTDFQARRGNIRFRRTDTKRVEFVHTLNGSGLAVGRTVLAILENYQEEDGSVTIPEVLRPFMGGLEKISPNTQKKLFH